MDVLVYSLTTYRDGVPSVWYPGLARNRQWDAERASVRKSRRLRLAGDLFGALMLFGTTYLALLVTP